VIGCHWVGQRSCASWHTSQSPRFLPHCGECAPLSRTACCTCLSTTQRTHTWRQADLEEGRNVFEEGNAFTMEAVQQQLDDLAAKHEAQVG